MMVQPFNDAVFEKANVNEVYGPVKVRSSLFEDTPA